MASFVVGFPYSVPAVGVIYLAMLVLDGIISSSIWQRNQDSNDPVPPSRRVVYLHNQIDGLLIQTPFASLVEETRYDRHRARNH